MKRKWVKIAIQTFIWLIFVGVFVVSLGFTEKQRNSQLCHRIIIQILDSSENHFIESNDIIQLLKDKNYKITNTRLTDLPLNIIEHEIKNLSVIKEAKAFTSLDGNLYIEVKQRTPILRIMNYSGESYYIDEDGVLFPLSDKYTARVLVVSGNINEPYNLFYGKNAKEAENQDELHRPTILDDVFTLCSYIYHDSIWNPMIEQVYVNEEQQFELIPKIGDFSILLGDTSDMGNKFNKLNAFYTIILPREGGNVYKKINLMYSKQIVCTKNILP
jgi:cell division protein FtsQ